MALDKYLKTMDDGVKQAVDSLYQSLDDMLNEEASRSSRPAVEEALGGFARDIWALLLAETTPARPSFQSELFAEIDRIRPQRVNAVYIQLASDNGYRDRLSEGGEMYARLAVKIAFNDVMVVFFEIFLQMLKDKLPARPAET